MIYKTLVLPGNGSKGIYTLGALEHLAEKGYLNDIDHYVTVSSGAIIGALIIAGLRPVDILARLLSKNLFQKVGRVSMAGIAGGASIFNFDPIDKELRSIFTAVIGMDPTLAEFYDRTERTFVCLGYDATQNKLLYFSKDTHPNLSLVTAIRASCAFPLLFEAVQLDEGLVFDGGVGCNYPLVWACNNFPGAVLSVHIGTRLKPISKTTPRLVTLKELIGYVIRRPDLMELELCRGKVTVFRIQPDETSFFDFSHQDSVYLDQFDQGYRLCKLNDAT